MRSGWATNFSGSSNIPSKSQDLFFSYSQETKLTSYGGSGRLTFWQSGVFRSIHGLLSSNGRLKFKPYSSVHGFGCCFASSLSNSS